MTISSAEQAIPNDNTVSRRPRIPALTGVRGYAACWVVLYHAGYLGKDHPAGAGLGTIPVIQSGYLGVDLFFILSGFVLYLTYSARLQPLTAEGLRSFAMGRIWRILPLHWFTMACFAAAGPIMGSFSPLGSSIGALVADALLIQNPLQMTSVWNPVSWSLSAEWFAYLGFPVLVVMAGRVRSPLACLLGIAIGFALFGALCARSDPPGLNHTRMLGLIRCLIEFSAGILLCRYSQLSAGGTSNRVTIVGLALLIPPLIDERLDVSALPAFGCLILGGAKGSPLAESVLGNRVAVFLGDISFSVYLLHVLVFQILLANLPPNVSQGTLVACLFAAAIVTLPLSWVVWRRLEVPAHAYGRRVARRSYHVAMTG